MMNLETCDCSTSDGRSIFIALYDDVLRRYQAWMSFSTAEESNRLTKQRIESVVGIIEQNKGHGGSCCAG